MNIYTARTLVSGYKIAGAQLGGGTFVGVPKQSLSAYTPTRVIHGTESMIVDKDSTIASEETFPDKHGRNKTYTLVYYEWKSKSPPVVLARQPLTQPRRTRADKYYVPGQGTISL